MGMTLCDLSAEAAHLPCLSGVTNRVHLDRGGAATERLGPKGLEHVQVRTCEATHGVGRGLIWTNRARWKS